MVRNIYSHSKETYKIRRQEISPSTYNICKQTQACTAPL